jgi:hypothetical protein
MPIRRTSNKSSYDSGFYNPEVYSNVGSRVVTDFDPNAFAYLSAVEAADGQALEYDVKVAVNNFVIGCKADGIWTAIKASCILAGARTLSGALVPLVGTAPTNNNFVSGDYNRETGLGDASNTTKYLDSNRNNNADPQNSNHNACFITLLPTGAHRTMGSEGAVAGVNLISGTGSQFLARSRAAGANSITVLASNSSLVGSSRSISTGFTARTSGINESMSMASETPNNADVFLYQAAGVYSNARLAFYSIGESLDLALLDTRVTTLVNAIAAAIP